MSDGAVPEGSGHGSPAWVAVPLAVAFGLVASIWVRYNHSWAENDTVILTRAARSLLQEGTVAPTRGAYDHGFGYPALVGTLSAVTGLPTRTIQVDVLPWLTLATAVMAFAAFRAVIGSGRGGAVASSLLMVQPDFLFVSQRGSHEKVTWTFVLTLLFALVVSLDKRRVRQVAPYVVTFYVCGFSLLTTNAFFASSFTTIILFALLGSLVVTRRMLRIQISRRLLTRLSYVVLVLTALTYVVIFYVYTPAGNNIANLGRAVDRIAALYLNVETTIESQVETAASFTSNAQVAQTRTFTSPYSTVALGWVSPITFVLLTLFTWIMLVSAVLSWILLAVTFVRRGVMRAELPLFLIWVFVAAAGVQIAVSVASDFAGVLGSNMQLRLFPVFTVFAIPLVVATVGRYRVPRRSLLFRYVTIGIGLLTAIVVPVAFPQIGLLMLAGVLPTLYVVLTWHRSVWARRMAVTAATAAFVYFAVAAVLKATNDPLVSNKWTFYSDGEARGVRWVDTNLARHFVWADFDERIGTVSDLELPDTGGTEAIWTRSLSSSVRYAFMSDVIGNRSIRIGQLLPQTIGSDQIYDNGSVEVMHQVPETPYQP